MGFITFMDFSSFWINNIINYIYYLAGDEMSTLTIIGSFIIIASGGYVVGKRIEILIKSLYKQYKQYQTRTSAVKTSTPKKEMKSSHKSEVAKTSGGKVDVSSPSNNQIHNEIHASEAQSKIEGEIVNKGSPSFNHESKEIIK